MNYFSIITGKIEKLKFFCVNTIRDGLRSVVDSDKLILKMKV